MPRKPQVEQAPLEGRKKDPEPPTPEQREAVEKARANRNQERLDRMNAIADSADDVRKDDMKETDGDKVFDPDETERKAQEESEEAERQLAKAKAGELQEEGGRPVQEEDEEESDDSRVVNGVRHYLTIVNGNEKWLTLEQLRSHAQKVESADEYLSQASEAVRNASALSLPQKDVPARVEKDDLRKLLASAALGEEEAIDKLASVLARPSEVTPDVLRQIDQRLSFRTELAQLESEQREILDNPMLARAFRARLNELKTEAPNTSLSKAYRSIGKEIREAFPEKFKPATTEDKLSRKRTLSTPPQSAGRQQAVTEEEPEESVSDVIEKMAKARGQRPIVHGANGRGSS